MDLIYTLSGKELYDRAIIFRRNFDFNNFIIYITMAANYDYDLAVYNIYTCKTYQKQNYAITLKFYEETAYNTNLKNSYSIHFLAYMYSHGLGVEKNYNKAYELYMMAIKKGNLQSLMNIGFLEARGVGFDFKKIIDMCNREIENNDIGAYNKLGYMHEFGYGMEINHVEAIRLYEIGVEKGHTQSLYMLARILENNSKHKCNYVKVLQLYKAAIKKDHLGSLICLANMYKDRYNIKQNGAKAIKLFEIAIEKGSIVEIDYVASHYIIGKFVPQNYDKAIKLYNLKIKYFPSNTFYLNRLLKIKCLGAEGAVT